MNLKRLARVPAGGFATEKTGGFKHRLRCDAMIFEQKKERPPRASRRRPLLVLLLSLTRCYAAMP
jgi:hypothetical protein